MDGKGEYIVTAKQQKSVCKNDMPNSQNANSLRNKRYQSMQVSLKGVFEIERHTDDAKTRVYQFVNSRQDQVTKTKLKFADLLTTKSWSCHEMYQRLHHS